MGSRGVLVRCSFRFDPTSSKARSMHQPLPIISGRQVSYTSGDDRALAMTSGPMPQGSPIVTATTGFRCSAMDASKLCVEAVHWGDSLVTLTYSRA